MEERRYAASDRAASKAIFLRLDQLRLRFELLAQTVQCTLQLYATGSLKEHDVAYLKIVSEPVSSVFRCAHEVCNNSTCSCSFHYKAGRAPHSDENIDLALCNVI